jgi:hypothetical protein
MATEKQRAAGRENAKRARAVQGDESRGRQVPKRSPGLSAADEDRVDAQDFAFPKQRKEPIHDARHVRNAIARFDQVEGVSDADRDAAWKRITAAARRFGVDVSEGDWRDLMKRRG